MMKVAISDAHAVTRAGVRSELESDSEFEVVGEGVDGDSTIALVRTTGAHVLTLDVSMPGVHGIELITQLRNEKSSLRILVLTMHSEAIYAVRPFKAGAPGFLTKPRLRSDLTNAIRKVASGRFT